jgi:hypothetical protein
VLEQRGLTGSAVLKSRRQISKDAIEFLAGIRPELTGDVVIEYALLDSVANVLCPACKLWNTGHGAQMMREAVSLMGGYGITEDCPGFLGHKWMDAQLEATYEGPEAVQRRQLSLTMADELFLTQFREWIREMRVIANDRPGTGACALATAMQMCWLLASRAQILDVIELEKKGPENPTLAEGLPGLAAFLTDLCHVQAARAAGEVGRICAELVHGYNRHPAWDTEGCASCYQAEDLDAMESLIPGIASIARGYTDVIEIEGAHPTKAGPCVRFDGLDQFSRLRVRMDGCLTGSQLAKDRAAEALTKVMIPEALDYPA